MKKSEQKRFEKLYRKHLRALKLQAKSDKTIDPYARALRRIATWFDCCPDRLARERWAVRVFPVPGRFIPRQRIPHASQFALAAAVGQKAVVTHPGVMGHESHGVLFHALGRPRCLNRTRPHFPFLQLLVSLPSAFLFLPQCDDRCLLSAHQFPRSTQ